MNRTSSFIAAEHLGAAAPWAFEPMDRPAHEAPLIHPHAVRDAQALGHAQGHAEGVQEATARVQAQMQAQLDAQLAQQAQQFAELFAAARSSLAQAEQQMARGTLEIACAIAQQVLRRELALPDADGLQRVATEAVRTLVEDGAPATLRLSAPDHGRLGLQISQALAGQRTGGLAVVADASLNDGDCVLEAADARIDASVAQRWAAAVGSLGLDVAWAADTAPPEANGDAA
ncbi:MAG: hypothetical protein EOO24_20910 [Comamonadaceae bacterium]|nr:MAG: hypothetical protein EOO24_20910 [Comamonadaceae bacterium]